MSKKHCIILILILGFFTRGIFLTSPNEVIFDEVHYGKFVDAYTSTGKYFFDVHPPWGKLLPAFLVKLSGYAGGQSFEKIGTPYQEASALVLRFFACLCGILAPLMVFLLLNSLGAGLPASLMGGLIFGLDNAFVLQSRVLMLYAPLVFFQISTLFFLLKALKSKKFYLFLSLAGLFGGLAVGTQFTGLTATFVALMVLLVDARKKPLQSKQFLIGLFCYVFFCAAVYLLSFYLHFHILPYPGPGDAFYIRTGNFWVDLIKLHEVMYNASATLTTSHPDQSPWYLWPFMTKPIFYWVGKGTSIYFFGNPVIWTLGSLLLAFALFAWPQKKKRHSSLWIVWALFAVSFFPLTLMSRVMFLYHYMVPILFGWLYLILWMESQEWIPVEWSGLRRKHAAFLGLLIVGYLWLVPVTYGLRVPDFYWKILPWQVYH